MKIPVRITVAAFALFFAMGTAAADAPGGAATLPADSIYQLDLALVDQNARALQLRELRGKPVLISMFYTSCPYMCPLIVEAIKRTEHALDASARAQLRVALVSFDSARDTPTALKATAVERHVDPARWLLTRTEPVGVRRLAAVLDVQYRPLPDGGFNHTSVLILLDSDGRVIARSENMSGVDADFLAAVKKATSAAR